MADVKTDEEKLNAVAVTAPKPVLAGGNRVSAIVPRDFEGCYRLANVIQASGLAPKSFKTVEQITVAMMHGMEVGLTPMAALQSIAVINGMPTIYGDGMLALVRASGLMEGIVEELERDDNGAVLMAVCKVKRAGEAAWTVRAFTWAEAMKAGLTRKDGPWTQYPQRMMQMRARSWALRDTFADVLRGLQQTEEALDMVDAGNGTLAPPEPTRAQFRQPAKSESVTDVVETAADPAVGQTASASAEVAHDPETGEIANATAEPVFEDFPTFTAFEAFSDFFLRSATEPHARAWEAHYREKLAKFAKHKDEKVQQATANLIGLYSAAIAPAQAA